MTGMGATDDRAAAADEPMGAAAEPMAATDEPMAAPDARLAAPDEPMAGAMGDPLALTEDEGDDVLLGNGAELFSRWERIQGRFVDEPRHAVEEADALVAQVVDDLSRAFADQREGLEHQWKAGEDVSTEELRRALQRYRAFFRRLVAV